MQSAAQRRCHVVGFRLAPLDIRRRGDALTAGVLGSRHAFFSRLAGVTATIILLVPHTGSANQMFVSLVLEVGWDVCVSVAIVWIAGRLAWVALRQDEHRPPKCARTAAFQKRKRTPSVGSILLCLRKPEASPPFTCENIAPKYKSHLGAKRQSIAAEIA